MGTRYFRISDPLCHHIVFIQREECYIIHTAVGGVELDRVPLQVEMLPDGPSFYNFDSAVLYVMNRHRKPLYSRQTSGLWKEVSQLTPKCVGSDGIVV